LENESLSSPELAFKSGKHVIALAIVRLCSIATREILLRLWFLMKTIIVRRSIIPRVEKHA